MNIAFSIILWGLAVLVILAAVIAIIITGSILHDAIRDHIIRRFKR